MGDSVLLVDRRQDVAVVTLNRPGVANGLNLELFAALTEALESLAGDEAVAGVVITGAGRFFCGGGDLRMLAEPAGRGAQARHDPDPGRATPGPDAG